MDIFIKSFNRPYLLHRTIASIYHCLKGFNGNIVVLDDGTPQKYLLKIQQLFPDVIIKKSPYYQEKSMAIEQDKIPIKKIPANFWRDEILNGSDYFILLEDDMWFATTLNYTGFAKEVYKKKMDMVKCMWLRNPKLISNHIVSETPFFKIVDPKVLTQNRYLFQAIFRTNRFKLGSFVRKFYSYNEEILKYYQLYVVAASVFSKNYYKTAWQSTQDSVNELLQIQEIVNCLTDFNFGNTHSEIIKATYKFTSSTIDKEKYGDNLDVFALNKTLNNAWFSNDYYDIFDFEKDISSEWIAKCCANSPVKFSAWVHWYEQFKKSYENMGCVIE